MGEGRGQIFHLEAGGKLVALEESPFALEEQFESLIADHPNLLPGDQVDPEDPRRWLVVGRQVEIPSENTSWALDLLLDDQDGIPTFVELKKGSNPELRRKVVGQMLDYAANASILWPPGALRSPFESRCAEQGIDPAATIADEPQIQTAPEEFRSAVDQNLKSRRIRLFTAAMALLAGLAAVSGCAGQPKEARCTRIIDGDSLELAINGSSRECRLDGIDAPESTQPFGRSARNLLSSLVDSRPLKVVVRGQDGYGRSLVQVWSGSTDVNLEMVQRGLAWHFKKYSSDRRLAQAEVTARTTRAGLWADQDPTPPWEFRRGHHSPLGALNLPPGSFDSARNGEPARDRSIRANRASHIYHLPGCPNFNCKNCTLEFASEADARAAGYRPGSCCPRAPSGAGHQAN